MTPEWQRAYLHTWKKYPTATGKKGGSTVVYLRNKLVIVKCQVWQEYSHHLVITPLPRPPISKIGVCNEDDSEGDRTFVRWPSVYLAETSAGEELGFPGSLCGGCLQAAAAPAGRQKTPWLTSAGESNVARGISKKPEEAERNKHLGRESKVLKNIWTCSYRHGWM